MGLRTPHPRKTKLSLGPLPLEKFLDLAHIIPICMREYIRVHSSTIYYCIIMAAAEVAIV